MEDRREMRGARLPRLPLLALLVSLFFWQTSCVVLDQMGLRGPKVWTPVKLPSFDSVGISAILNDTVFTVEACRQYVHIVKGHSQRQDTLIAPALHVPRLSLWIHNRSSMNLLFPQKYLHVRGRGMSGPAEVRVIIGRSDPSRSATRGWDPHLGHARLNSDHDDYFAEITAHDSLFLESLVINPLFEARLGFIGPGTYWVVLGYESVAFESKTVPIWEGTVWSDTVYFRVTP